MSHRVDPVLAQYRRVAWSELSLARAALEWGDDPDTRREIIACLRRVCDMAGLLRHRRTVHHIELLLQLLDGERGIDVRLGERAFDAIDRLVSGGRPDPSVAQELAVAVGDLTAEIVIRTD